MSDSVAAVEARGVLSRAVGVIVSPGETFAAVAASPRPAGILLLVCLVVALGAGLPQFNDRVRQSAVDMQVRQMERSGRTLPPEAVAQMERFSRYSPYITMASIFIVVPVASLFFAAFFWGLFNAILGGTATFKQVLGIVTHSQVIGALGALVSMPLVYLQGVQTMAGPFNLGALAPMLEPGSTLAAFLGAVSVFTIWQIVVSAIGLAVLYRRKSTPIAIGLLLLYFLLTAAFTTAFSSMMGR